MKKVILWIAMLYMMIAPVDALNEYVKTEYGTFDEMQVVEITKEHEDAIAEIDNLMVELFENTWKDIK